MRIETRWALIRSASRRASPGRKAGCGLKPPGGGFGHRRRTRITRPKGRVRIETPPCKIDEQGTPRITRPKGRVRIETWCRMGAFSVARERITRPKGRVRIETIPSRAVPTAAGSITRPKGRVRIETVCEVDVKRFYFGITRPKGRVRIETFQVIAQCVQCVASPGRKAGCGLKPFAWNYWGKPCLHHPAERPGAD